MADEPDPSLADIVRHAESRGCYCFLWRDNVESLESEGVPRGYCGFCDVCGSPGHTRPYPGPRPFTGCWCDRCFEQLDRGNAIGVAFYWIALILGALGVIAAVARLTRAL
ncbi:MAG: hypothetical protein AMXMBFR84_49750 [Candidatus Hydrogenedentota bacterium]